MPGRDESSSALPAAPAASGALSPRSRPSSGGDTQAGSPSFCQVSRSGFCSRPPPSTKTASVTSTPLTAMARQIQIAVRVPAAALEPMTVAKYSRIGATRNAVMPRSSSSSAKTR